MILADLAIVAVSLAVLSVAASQFITGASRIATALGASPLFIGAVLLGAGTSLPDGLVSAFAAARGEGGLALGNVIGSNTFNITLVLGAAATITVVAVTRQTLRREALLTAGAVTLFLLLAAVGLNLATGIVLLVLTPIALWAIRGHPPEPSVQPKGAADEISKPIEVIRSIAGLGFTVISSRILVEGATGLATTAGVSEAIIGLTLVAVGTSIPELAVSIQAARQKATDLLVGNVLGSNLINSLLIGGVIGILTPDTITLGSLMPAGVLMLVVTVGASALLATGRKLVAWEGWVLVIGYLIATAAVTAI
jgi:cation:H+ antiporter